ncbi:hypothetical protein [Lysobacter gummosus]
MRHARSDRTGPTRRARRGRAVARDFRPQARTAPGTILWGKR